MSDVHILSPGNFNMTTNDGGGRPTLSARAEQLLALTGAGRAVLRDRAAEKPMTERHRYLLSLTGAGQALLRERERKKGGA